MVGPLLSGRKVNLRPLRDDDLPRRIEWLNDVETFKLLTGSPPSRSCMLSDALQWRRVLEADQASVVFAIEASCGEHIGDVDLHSIDRHDKSARLTILLGNKAFWSRGYGTDAVRTLLGYAFSDLGLDKVMLRVYGFNKRAIRCYEKCGFRETGSIAGDHGATSEPVEISMVATREHFQGGML